MINFKCHWCGDDIKEEDFVSHEETHDCYCKKCGATYYSFRRANGKDKLVEIKPPKSEVILEILKKLNQDFEANWKRLSKTPPWA
jgi:hypothetical protein